MEFTAKTVEEAIEKALKNPYIRKSDLSKRR